jgi:hypothetical protein
MSYGPELDSLMIYFKKALDAVNSQTDGTVYLESKQIETPPLGIGIMHAVQFKVKGRPVYSAHLFHYWVNVWDSSLIIDWKGKKKISSESELKDIISAILTDSVVQTSIDQLKDFAQGIKEGVVKTIDPHTLGSLDFLVEITDEEFLKIESGFNNQCTVDILATESQQRSLPNGFHAELVSKYKYLDTQGMIMDIEKIEKQGDVLHIRVSDVR